MQYKRNIMFCLLFCLQCLLARVSALSIELWEETVAAQNENMNQIVDWKCSSNADCVPTGSICIDGSCQCPVGYVFNTRMTSCVKVATAYGDECEDTIQCSRYLLTGASCIDNICVCGEGYYYLHGKCNAYSELFGKCKKDDDCYVNADFEATSCQEGICVCSPGFYQREYRTCRRIGNEIGSECTVKPDCRFSETAYCDKKFKCVENTTSSESSQFSKNLETYGQNYTDVYNAFHVGDNCTTDTECKVLGSAICGPFGTCICERAHYPSSKKDKCVPELGESCQNTADATAHIKDSVCRNGRLSCVAYKVPAKNNRKCEKVTRTYKGSCRLHEQCFVFGPDAFCQEKKCVCNKNSRHLEDELFCWTKKGVDEACKNDIDCYVEGINVPLVCKKNICSCPDGMRINSNGTACVESSAEIGMICDNDMDCATKNSVCADGICACIENYYESKKECVPGINSTCTETKDCTPANSVCSSKVCSCKENYVAASVALCLPVASYGKSCEHDIQCTTITPNMICSLPEDTEREFLLKAESENKLNICTCKKGYRYKYDTCSKMKVLGESCMYRGECYLDHNEKRVVCKNGQCACDWDYIRVNSTACEMSLTKKRYVNGSSTTAISSGLMTILLFVIKYFNLN